MSQSPKRTRSDDDDAPNPRETKRARLDFLNAHSEAVMDKVIDKYLLAMKLADKFFDHVKELFNHEAMYWENDSTFMMLDNPRVHFDWGCDEDKYDDGMNIFTSAKPLEVFFDKYYRKPLWGLKPEERLEAHEMLTAYFVSVPTVDLVIENWSNDCYRARGGRIGASTGGQWIEAEPGSSEEDEGSE